MAPISVPGAPWSPSGARRSPKSFQKHPQRDPKETQGRPLGAPGASQERPRVFKERPKGAQERSWDPPEILPKSSWNRPKSVLERLGRPLFVTLVARERLGRPRRQIRIDSEPLKSPQRGFPWISMILGDPREEGSKAVGYHCGQGLSLIHISEPTRPY